MSEALWFIAGLLTAFPVSAVIVVILMERTR